ncbi:MAG: DUF4292 domain-containing protein [Bacteroidetes bacterium]|nr:DUF4292 domain-containing protein [Bacteroidota bacterium]
MGKINRIFLLGLATVLIMAASCRSKKQITDKPRQFDSVVFSPPVMGELKGDPLIRTQWDYFSSRMAVDFNDGENEMSGNISLRMRKDSLLWFSASASLGIQVAKGIITRDSVKILDLINKNYYLYGIKDLAGTFGAEISLRELQNLILGNPMFDTISYQMDTVSRGWFGIQPPLTQIVFTGTSLRVDSTYLTQKGTERQLRANYSGEKSAGAYSVAEKLAILAFGASKNVRFDIAFTTASDEYIPSYPFSIPEGYSQKSQ